jgi:exodeoxyribonuclease V alpha subunit
VEKFGTAFAIGDKVMQLENNYDRDTFNGDLGFISGLDEEEGEVTVDFDGCATQGSEYPAVVIPVVTQHYTMLQRNLLYTGLTRGKRLVVLVGQRKAVGIAVRGVQGRRRWSKLKELLTMDEEAFASRPTVWASGGAA